MPALTLSPANRNAVLALLAADRWMVACLCAAWCDVCTEFRDRFDGLALQHPDKTFLWIDVEDEADVAGDYDVENFPTLLIQQSDAVSFFGTIEPDGGTLGRLVAALAGDTVAASRLAKREKQLSLRQRLLAAGATASASDSDSDSDSASASASDSAPSSVPVPAPSANGSA